MLPKSVKNCITQKLLKISGQGFAWEVDWWGIFNTMLLLKNNMLLFFVSLSGNFVRLDKAVIEGRKS